jgi:hypothetical protein
MNTPVRVGRYEIVRRLGKSMGEVFLAKDTAAGGNVALKLVPLAGDSVSQLKVEAEWRGAEIQKQMSALDSRVVEVYEFGEEGGYFYVAMRYVEGKNLAEVLRSERAIDPIRAATIALEVCEQLAKFHSWDRAVVHGDIKPSNIHLGYSDTVRLLDFGIAKTLAEGHDHTKHNFGSPGYCAPERLSRSVVDQQSDLWALGATLYEMLAGAPAYQAEDTRRLEELIQSKRPPRALPVRCPRPLRAIVMKALAPDPTRRYPSARDFQADLQAFLEHRMPAAETERRPGWHSTIEAARAGLQMVTRTAQKVKRPLGIAGAAASFATGMFLWIGGNVGWNQFHLRHVDAAPARPPAAVSAPAPPAKTPEEELGSLYVAAGEKVLDTYHHSTDPNLSKVDWHKAEVFLERAIALGSRDDRVQGELALSRGYSAMERLEGGHYSEHAAATLRQYARDQFLAASQKIPNSADPPLALRELALRESAAPHPKPPVHTAASRRRRWR